MVLLFVGAGVVRIGPPVNGGPVVLAPDPGGCRTASPHSMARRRDVGRNLNRRISAPARSASLRAAGAAVEGSRPRRVKGLLSA